MRYFDEVPLDPQLYLVEGDPQLLDEFTAYLLVKRAPSLVLDGGNKFNPFTISFFCRKLNKDVMDQIFVSRAFTVFQLKVLIGKALLQIIPQKNPSVVVVSWFSSLFHSDDVEEEILTILYKKLLLQLKGIVKTYTVPVVVTDQINTSSLFDCKISLKTRSKSVILAIDQKRLQFPLIPSDQKTLDFWRCSHG